jgi:LmbE family N-acetylglucosaminyl deacetylase
VHKRRAESSLGSVPVVSDALEPLPEDWNRALAVVAHPDDMEYGAASAVAHWTAQGKDVAYLMVTRGEAGISDMAPAEVGPIRGAEQRASCDRVGVATLEFLDHPDGLVTGDLALRRDLAAAIRRHRPDVVLSINFRENFGGPGWNHVDHRVVGVTLLDAIRDAANPWLFDDAGDPWGGVRFAAFGGSPQATHFLELTEDDLQAGIESLECHRIYLDHLEGDMAEPTVFLRRFAEAAGGAAGVALAATFEVI